MRTIIEIRDTSSLKITRVRDWSILFDFEDKHYLIHGKYECGEGSWQELYERELYESGKYKLNFIKNITGDEHVASDYIKNWSWNKKSIVYSQIDMDYFALKLTQRGFATGIFEEDVEKKRFIIKQLREQSNHYERKCREIRNKINELS